MAQVSLLGEVRHNQKALDGVTVQIFEDGKILRTIATNKRGKYQIDIPFEREYTLVYRAQYMIPVSIVVNSSISRLNKDKLIVEVPVNMELFQRFEGLDVKAYQLPIGIVKESDKESELFKFYPNAEVISSIGEVNKKSIILMSQGQEPLITKDSEVKKFFFASKSVENNLETDKPRENSSISERNSKVEDTESDSELNEKILDVTSSQFDQQEVGFEEAAKVSRQNQKHALASKESTGNNQHEYIFKTKQIKGRELEELDRKTQDFTEARIGKQEYLAELITWKPLDTLAISNKPKLSSKSVNEGFILSEELLNISEGGVRKSYRHDNYDWIFFELDYYYMDKEEITKEQYDQAKRLFE